MPPIAPADVVVSVDTHKHVHAAIALSGLGARLGTITVPASLEGYRELEAWACSFGIVGTGSYGAGLARALVGRGHAVVEVNWTCFGKVALRRFVWNPERVSLVLA
jgi:transposase